MFNEVILIGKLAKEPQITVLENGQKESRITLAIERPYRNPEGFKDVDLIRCILWKGISDMVEDHCDIGTFLGVKGRLQAKKTNAQDDDSTLDMEVKVEHLEFLEKHFM